MIPVKNCLLFIVPVSFWLSLHGLVQAQPDPVPVADKYTIEGENVILGKVDNTRWWELLGDETLNGLIREAQQSGTDVLAAITRIDQARARSRAMAGYFFPSFSAQGTVTASKSNLLMQQGLSAEATVYGTFVDMTWEIDVFGEIRQSYYSSRALFQASESQLNAVLVTLQAEVASAYINLRTYQQQMDVGTSNLASQLEILNITRARREAGLSSDLDVSQAESVYASTKTNIPLLENQINYEINSICYLLGMIPGSLDQRLREIQTIPQVPDSLVVSIPRDVMRQRPDIMTSEKQFGAQLHALKATRSGYLPKFYLAGNVGYQSKSLDQFGHNDFLNYQVGPVIKWTLFQGNTIRQNVREQEALLKEAELRYRSSVLNALTEVNNALSSYQNCIASALAVKAALDAANTSLTLATELYKNGLCDFHNVLDAQRQKLSFENQDVLARSNIVLSLVNVYRALGGGWQNTR